MSGSGFNPTRRDLLAGALGGTMNLTLADCIAAQTASAALDKKGHAIGGIRVGAPKIVPDNFGDTWVSTWSDDGHLYTPSNDTTGFQVVERISRVLPNLTNDQKRQIASDPLKFFQSLPADKQGEQLWYDCASTIAFNRLEGSNPLELKGVTVNTMPAFSQQDHVKEVVEQLSGQTWRLGADGCTWKSSGCTSVDGALYWVVARHKYGEFSADPQRRQLAMNASILKATDFGRTWLRSSTENLAAPMFPGSNFATPYFVDYGRHRPAIDDADRYVYAISNNGFWDNGDWMILGRVPRTRIGQLNAADWEFFAGGKPAGPLSWTPDSSQATPILENHGRLGMTGAAYLPAWRRYLMIGWYYPAGSGKVAAEASTKTVWDFYEAPKPWGPWTQIASHTWTPSGYYCPVICPKFQSAKRLYVLTAGDFKNWRDFYRLTVVPIDLDQALS